MQAVVERCGHKLPRVHSLITLGGQHQGVANTPGCSTDLTGAAAKACTAMQLLLAQGAYAPWVRSNLVQAQYFKDPHNLDEYLAANEFLPDINNERPEKNSQYADNMAALKRFVMIRFDGDTTGAGHAARRVPWSGVVCRTPRPKTPWPCALHALPPEPCAPLPLLPHNRSRAA